MIRAATPDDTAAVVEIAVDSGLFPADDAGIVATMTAGPGACAIDENGQAAAVAYYQPAPATDGTWYLTMIAVRAVAQGQCRGTVLLRHVEQDLRARGGLLLLVETSGLPSFARTRAFYAGCGYKETARVPDYFEPGDDMVLFRKALT